MNYYTQIQNGHKTSSYNDHSGSSTYESVQCEKYTLVRPLGNGNEQPENRFANIRGENGVHMTP